MDEDTSRVMAALLTAVAELALLACSEEKWVTGRRATKYRRQYELLGELLGDVNDRLEKGGA